MHAPGSARMAEGRRGKQQGNGASWQSPSLSLPNGGGAIQGIGEKFQANPVTGTGSMSVPIAMSAGRGFAPQLGLSYDSGSGNGAFGLGWDVGMPSVSRKTQTGLPQYDGLPRYEDAFESDVFLLSGAEDLVPVLDGNGVRDVRTEGDFTVFRYRPRAEGLFARIEKWVHEDGTTHWRSITKENISTLYGASPEARIADPADARKVFQWLIEKNWDDKGNVILYEYKKEDGAGLSPKPIYEKNRSGYAQTYLKRVLYGNTVPYQDAAFAAQNEWLFSLIFDYGEHWQPGDAAPHYEEQYPWALRPDTFSSFRSGFDIRTYRLCRRILMFHHFEAELGVKNYLVKATHLEYDENPIATRMLSVTHTGYRRDAQGEYVAKSFPPVSFAYTEQKIDETIYSIHAEDLPNAPQGIDGQMYQFNDLYGEGLNGILKQNGTAWYYKRNLGDGRFGPQELVAETPSLSAGAQVQITDFGGDGLTDMLVQTGDLNGYFELSEEGRWSHFRPFAHPVNFSLNDPALRMIDLDGNGIPDIAITEDDCLVWYPADARDGYKAARRVAKALDEESGPRIVFNEAFQTIFLADMSGDGLTDIVRIRNGEVCYWANMGYGRFSAKITMQGAPHFDLPDQYDPARLRLADIDGSGPTDILYLGRNDIRYWHNQSGNSWSAEKTIHNFPRTTNLHTVSVFDLLGNGTACIVWASPLPAEANTPMKYIQLMGNSQVEGNKPYLLKEVDNNMGAVTRLKYEASTKFYLEDKKQNRPWITKLPFPVQVLVRQEVYDEIAGNHFVSSYAYHHGYFDRTEREFRGFGMVEQWDTEDYATLSENSLFEAKGQNWSEQTDMPPVYTKTWFHTGYWREGGKITRQYEREYYSGDPDAWALPDTVFPAGLSAGEQREAARACKGRPLRVETYALDGSAAEPHPYTVAETAYHIKTIQPRGDNRFASFYVCECETLTYHYERNPADPRIAHQSTLKIDDYGNVLQAAAIVYPRRVPPSNSPQGGEHHPEQNRGYVTLAEADFINKPDETDWYRIGVPYAQRSYEITGLTLNQPYDKEALQLAIAAAVEIPYEQAPGSGIQKRLLAAAKTSFYDAALSGELPFGQIASHALPYHAYEAVYTAGLIAQFEKDGQALLGIAEIENEAGFLPMDGLWWRHSGRAEFDAAQFYHPLRQYDPLGHPYEMGYDAYHLAMTETSTEVHGQTVRSSAHLDYRTLQPARLTDPNGNHSEAIFDEMGMVIATAVTGKNGEGDTLAGYQYAPYPDQDMRALMQANPHAYLQGATAFFYYDLNAWRRDGQPNHAIGIVRETHVADENGTPTKTQISFSYSDGFGQAIMMKVQAEPGDAFRMENGAVVNDPANPRWVGNGRTVFDNKGNPVKQYEPYFSHTYGYETESELVEYGVSPVLHYDPLGRNIRTDLPDGAFTKAEFTPWEQHTWDQNDTVMESLWYKRRTDANDPNYISDSHEQGAAQISAAHAGTPLTNHLDTLGRSFLVEEHNGSEGVYQTRIELDIAGNQRSVTDALGRVVMATAYNLAGEPVHTRSMDAGRRWMLANALGNPCFSWDERNHEFRYYYDVLQRPTHTKVLGGDGDTPLDHIFDRVVYGETQIGAAAQNLIGQVFRHYDTGGMMEMPAYDFKGQPVASHRRLFKHYKAVANWTDANLSADLEPESFTFITETDALGRISRQTAPDGSIIIPSYNRSGVLDGETVQHPVGAPAHYLKKIEYNEKGQRTRIQYGNDVVTKFYYHRETFRLTRLESKRQNGDPLQDWRYTYDPVGNITHIEDKNVPVAFFDNQKITGSSEYTYDALYRLVGATGRENNAALHFGTTDNWNDAPFLQALHPGDPMAQRNYAQRYRYDAVGNILQMRHLASGNNWTRDYHYAADSNRLLRTQVGSDTYHYPHHAQHGYMTALPHLEDMGWNFKEEIVKTIRQRRTDGGTPETTYYQYDAQGQRIRKITENTANPGATPTRKDERIYIAGYEVYKKHSGPDAGLERVSMSLLEQGHRFVMVETRNAVDDGTEKHLVRYQLHNHLGSAALELDAAAQVISYEEYHSYGTTAWQARNAAIRSAAKRYRYTGMERDEETGLEYHSARYYLPWLGRWCSADPIGIGDGVNVYGYGRGNPIIFLDENGAQSNPEKHTIVKGDTYWSLAQKSGGEYTVEDLKRWNPGVDWMTLQIGTNINTSNPHGIKNIELNTLQPIIINENPSLDSDIKYIPIENPSDYDISWSIKIEYEGKISATFQVGYEKSDFLFYGYAYSGLEFKGGGKYDLGKGSGNTSMSFNFIYGYGAGYSIGGYTQESTYSGVVPLYSIGDSQEKNEFELNKFKYKKDKPLVTKPSPFEPSILKKLSVGASIDVNTSINYDSGKQEAVWKTNVTGSVNAKMSIPVVIPGINVINPQVIIAGYGKVSVSFYVKFAKKKPAPLTPIPQLSM